MNSNIVLLIALGTAATLFMAIAIVLFVVFYQKRMLSEQLRRQELEKTVQRQILQATLESQEAERRKVAADLHDSIGGMLSAIRVGVSRLATLLPEPQKMEASKQMLDDTIDAVRQISRDLMPATLEKFGLATAVRELAERLQATSHIQIGVVEMGTRTEADLSKSQELMLFRIAQELLNNAIKHAQATYIEVVLSYGAALQLTVEDNGVGLSREQIAQSRKTSLGLFNVQSRLQLLHAHLEVDDRKTDGCKITVTLPLAHGS